MDETNARLAHELTKECDSEVAQEAAKRLRRLPNLPRQVSNTVDRIRGLGYSGTKVRINTISDEGVPGHACPEYGFHLTRVTVRVHPERPSDTEHECLACATDIDAWHEEHQQEAARAR